MEAENNKTLKARNPLPRARGSLLRFPADLLPLLRNLKL